MSNADPISYTLIADDGLSSLASTQELRQALEKGSDDVKLETLRKIIVSTINGAPHVRPRRLLMSPCLIQCVALRMERQGRGAGAACRASRRGRPCASPVQLALP